MSEYRYREFCIPERMMGSIKRYIEYGIEPGAFLTAIITNSLSGAVSRADDENLRNIPAYVSYFYNEAPSPCHGYAGVIEDWQGRLAEAEAEAA